MGLYSRGVNVGAVAIGPVTQTDFQTIADEALFGSPSRSREWIIVRVEDDGAAKVFGFDEDATGSFRAIASQTPGSALVALYRQETTESGKAPQLVDSAYRPPRKFSFESRKERVGTGWILGGVALGMLGIAMGFRKGKG